MKNLTTSIFVILLGLELFVPAFADQAALASTPKKYFLSALGDDANTGTSPALPWKTIARLNLVTYVPGDSVFFRCGDIFYGSVNVLQGGTSSSRVVFSSYGSGSKPVISGTETVSGWATAGGSLYSATYTGSVTSFFVDGKEKTIARYPNDHQYLNLDTASNTWLRDDSLAFVPAGYVNGSKVCIHTAQWCWEKSTVASYASNTITYGSPTLIQAIAGYGYFLYDNLAHLDTVNEWKYDSVSHTLYYFPPAGENPDLQTCEVSVNSTQYKNGFLIGANASRITIRNLAFEKQANAGISMLGVNNQYVLIDNCNFFGQYNYGVIDKGNTTRTATVI